jgi:GNAT superfamily N-acetyltransferase
VPTDGIEVRRAAPAESDRVADLMWRVREQSAVRGSIPPSEHPLMDMRTWMSRLMRTGDHDVWVALDQRRFVGVLVLSEPDWLEHLYVDETHTGRGLGSRLVALAKAELGGPVQLWTFQSNTGARRFYERHGFVAVEETDGDNEEGEPDVRYLFSP